MKTLLIICKHAGEVSHTPRDPRGHVIGFDGDTVTAVGETGKEFEADLSETCSRLISSDWWEPCTVDLWDLQEVNVFDWMSGPEFLRNCIAVRWFKGFGGSLEWSRQWFFKLAGFGEAYRYAAIQLLNVKSFRSSFRKSLRDQLEAWLNDPSPRFQSPFSPRQWDLACNGHTARKARQIATGLYNNRRLY